MFPSKRQKKDDQPSKRVWDPITSYSLPPDAKVRLHAFWKDNNEFIWRRSEEKMPWDELECDKIPFLLNLRREYRVLCAFFQKINHPEVLDLAKKMISMVTIQISGPVSRTVVCLLQGKRGNPFTQVLLGKRLYPVVGRGLVAWAKNSCSRNTQRSRRAIQPMGTIGTCKG